MPERLPSRAALLELRREHAVMDLGYRFLDEKRIALAQELIRLLREHAHMRERFRRAQDLAREAMTRAVEIHGLEGVQLYPPSSVVWTSTWSERSLFGLALIDVAVLEGRSVAGSAACLASADAQRSAELFAELCRLAMPLAAMEANLRRLVDDFRRTQRRVNALEHVILPEVCADEKHMENLIEELDQEEAIRVHLFAKSFGEEREVREQ
ncbi:MAG: V-type ATP synthase subunit D [Rudaea sp.]